jgi:hypothetical protein
MLASTASQQLRCCCQHQPLRQQLRLLRSMQACHALCSPAHVRKQQQSHSTTSAAFKPACSSRLTAVSSSSSSQLFNLLRSSRRTRAYATVAARAAAAQKALDVAEQEQQRLPVTVISGFLGGQS